MSRSTSMLVPITLVAAILFCGMQYGKYSMKVDLPDVDRHDIDSKGGITNEETTQSNSAKEKILECAIPLLVEAQQFLNYGKKQNHCKKLVPFGGLENSNLWSFKDGQKIVCEDENYKINPKNCVVLSFGIGYDWSFDDAMDKYGCKVFSFDPTIGLKDHKRSKNIQFLNLGIGSEKRIESSQNYAKEYDRYEEILQKLKLTNTVIDYLKMDVEGSEIEFFNDVFLTSPQLLDNVKQIGMEVHPGATEDDGPPTGNMYSYWIHMHLLECLGFKLISWEANMAGPNSYKWRNRLESASYEVVWGKSP